MYKVLDTTALVGLMSDSFKLLFKDFLGLGLFVILGTRH